jgi:hypothetical protein
LPAASDIARPPGPRPRPPAAGQGALLIRHAVFLGLLGAGAVLRGLTTLAYRPAMEFVQDSFDYLGDARSLAPSVIRPLGYPLFLRALSVTGRFGLVAVAQHLLGLAMAVMLYQLLLRLGVRPWLAALATAPLLLDAYAVYMEQFVLAETLFGFLALAGFVVLLWRLRPSAAACALAAALLACAALTRTVGLALLAPALGYLLVTRAGVRRVGSFAGMTVVLLGAYAGWYKATNGHWGLQTFDGYFLAGRVEPFADCGPARLDPVEQLLCDERPVAERPSPDWYVWNPGSPLRRPDLPQGTDRNAVAGSMARRVILSQPGDYASTVAQDFLHYFSPVRTGGRRDGLVQTFQFRTSFVPDPWQPEYPPSDPYVYQWTWPGNSTVRYGNIVATHGFDLARAEPRLDRGIADGLRSYQRFGYTPGPVLVLAVIVVLAAATVRLPVERRPTRWVALVLAGSGLLLLMVPSATASFDFRYLVPALTLLPAAGALGVTVLAGRRSVLLEPPGGAERHHAAVGPVGLTRLDHEPARTVPEVVLVHPPEVRDVGGDVVGPR